MYINLGGRVIPIEEKAAIALEAYFASLKKMFEKEEGWQDIMEDIESRFSEHFQEKLDAGNSCIQSKHVHEIMGIMGMPEDFADVDDEQHLKNEESSHREKRFYRNANDKILGGVCSGLANYFSIDPVIIRIVFALTVIGGLGIGILLYVLLWIFLPLESGNETHDSKLFRSKDDRMIAGVAGGLGQYFGISAKIPRLIFVLPFLISLFSGILFFPFGIPGTVFVIGSLGSTVLIIYLIMWVVIPEAKTRTQKMQMQRESVTIQNIIKSVKEEVDVIEDKARKKGEELGKDFESLGKSIEKKFQTGSAKIETESREFSKRAERKAHQMEQELKESLSKKGNPIAVFFKALSIILVGSLFTLFLILFLAALFFSVQLEPYLTYLTYTESDKWLFYLLLIGMPFMLFWSFGMGFIKIFSGNNLALSVVQGITVFMWVSLSISILFLGYNYSKNFRSKTHTSKEVLVVNQSELQDNIQIQNAAQPRASNLFSNTQKVLTQGDTLYIQNISFRITQTEDTLLRVFAEVEIYQQQTGKSNSMLITQPGLEFKNNTLYLPSYHRLQPGEKLKFLSLTYHVQVPKDIAYHASFWQEFSK